MHLGDDRLESYAMGRLGEDESAPVEEHLLTCQSCRDRLTEYDAYTRAMREACRQITPRALRAGS